MTVIQKMLKEVNGAYRFQIRARRAKSGAMTFSLLWHYWEGCIVTLSANVPMREIKEDLRKISQAAKEGKSLAELFDSAKFVALGAQQPLEACEDRSNSPRRW